MTHQPFDMDVLNVRAFEEGYEVRTERLWLPRDEAGNIDPITVKSAYTADGLYLGDDEWAHQLYNRFGITKPETRPVHVCEGDDPPEKLCCSNGFNEQEQKWYGWSHRALAGFGIGDVVDSDEHCCATSGWTDDYIAEHPEIDTRLPVGFTAKTLEDAKRMAIAFAESVG